MIRLHQSSPQTTTSLNAGVELVDGCDSVVGFGGGSSLDSAKAIAVLAKHGGELSRFKVPVQTPAGLPVVAIPTTAGTGSEVTRVAIVTDDATDEKMLLMGAGLLPEIALVDYELTMAKPYARMPAATHFQRVHSGAYIPMTLPYLEIAHACNHASAGTG